MILLPASGEVTTGSRGIKYILFLFEASRAAWISSKLNLPETNCILRSALYKYDAVKEMSKEGTLWIVSKTTDCSQYHQAIKILHRGEYVEIEA